MTVSDNPLADANSICQIIKECAKGGVSELKLGNLSLVFGPKDKSDKPLEAIETRSFEQETQKISNEAEAQRLAERVQQDLEELSITDPAAYERMLSLQGDLGNVGETS